LCRLSLRRPSVILSCQLVVASPLVVLSLRRPLVVLSRQLVVASPLAVLSLRHPLLVLSLPLVVALPLLVVAWPLAVFSLRHPLVNSSRQLVVASPLLVLSLRPTPPSRRAGWLLRRLSMHRPLIVSLSRRVASHFRVAPAGCRAIISRRPLVAPPSRPLIVLAGCCVASPCASLSS
jgi:hypothetical protein